MDTTVLEETLRGVLDAKQAEGKDHFQTGELYELISDLEDVPAQELRAALDQLQRSGYPIYCNTIGPVKDQLWEFGQRRAPKPVKRNPIGRRRTP